MTVDYRFLRKEKNPIIDLIRTEMQRLGGDDITYKYLERIAHKSGVSVTTLNNWLFGDTLQPQHLTVRFVLSALDLRMAVVRRDGTEVRGPRNVTNTPRHTRHAHESAHGVAGHA